MESGGKKRFRSKQERRQIVEESFKPGASVARVARAHEINANQLFHWRKQYREGWFNEAADKAAALVPVKISSVTVQPQRAVPRTVKPAGSGSIDIDLGHARVRIEGSADPDCVRAALEGLAR